jgi:hypothetical protein
LIGAVLELHALHHPIDKLLTNPHKDQQYGGDNSTADNQPPQAPIAHGSHINRGDDEPAKGGP